MKHQLESKTICHPESKAQVIEILQLAKERGLLDDTGYSQNVLEGRREWPYSNVKHEQAVSFGKDYVHAYGQRNGCVIPVYEFVLRLKGEWVEPSVTALETPLTDEERELLSRLIRNKFDSNTFITDKDQQLISLAEKLGLTDLATEMKNDLI